MKPGEIQSTHDYLLKLGAHALGPGHDKTKLENFVAVLLMDAINYPTASEWLERNRDDLLNADMWRDEVGGDQTEAKR